MTSPRNPNIIYILSDQHSPMVAGCYGDKICRTPNLDNLAARGVAFDNAYTAAPVCVPARMSILTGCLPNKQDCWTNTDVLASDRPTYAHGLGAGGIHTRIVGRVHSLGTDQLRGFAERFVGDHSANHVGGQPAQLGVLANTAGPGRRSLEISGAGQSAYELHDRDVEQACIRLADTLAVEQSSGNSKPFFLHIGLMLPHHPYVGDPELFDYYYKNLPEPEVPPTPLENEHAYLRIWRNAMNISDVSAEEVRRARAAYYALTETMDRMIGSILSAYESKGLLENTLVIYCSDHGDQIGERGLWWKHTFFEQSVRVPLLMSWPGVIPEDERRDQIVNLIDLAPTFLETMGAPELPDIDGVSLLSLARDATTPWENETFSEYCTDGQIEGMPLSVQQRMIRSGPWKAIYYEGFPMQLFNLESDPFEQIDLAHDPAHQTILKLLRNKILSGWDPQVIAAKMQVRKTRKSVMKAWAANTQPADQFRWKLKAEDNWLAAAKPDI